MRALVTGGAGFIGSHLVDALVARGDDVLVIDDLSNPVTDYRNARASYRESSIQTATLAPSGHDVIFHLGGKVGPLGVMRWAGRIATDTIDAARAVASWGQLFGCPVIDVSTSEIYGEPTGRNSERTPRAFTPGSSARMEYAVAKLAAETMLLNTEDLDVRIVRPFNVTGPRQLPDGGFVLPRFVSQVLNGQSPTIYRPGTQRRAFTHVSDIVAGIIAAHERGKPGEAYNLGNIDNECSVTDLAHDVLHACDAWYLGTQLVDPTALHGKAFREAPDKLPDATKAMRELGWSPAYDRAAIVADVVDYWRRR